MPASRRSTTTSPGPPGLLDGWDPATRDAVRRAVDDFDPDVPIARAWTPPATWCTHAAFHALDRAAVFAREWIAVGVEDAVPSPGAFLSGDLAGLPWFVVRREDGALAAFHNACRHHATVLLEGTGCAERVTCPYHGWTYALDGALLTAPGTAGIEAFDRDAMGLRPIAVDTWRGLVFLNLSDDPPPLRAGLASLDAALDAVGGGALRHVATRTSSLRCNWKVFVDNYLDGGYHVPHLHPSLASGLDLDGYRTEVLERGSVQGCGAKGGRLGAGAAYAWLHPSLMLNRYGPVLDTNRVVPLGPDRTLVVFDFWFTEEALADTRFVEDCLRQSDAVQREDVAVCEAVQRGLASPGYVRGRYAPRLEHGEHDFHRRLAAAYREVLDAPAGS